VNDSRRGVVRGVFHPARAVAPQRPFGRPARAFFGSVVWPPRDRFSTPFTVASLLDVAPA
jgi:hypothetical protein